MIGIYCIRRADKFYVGQAADIACRWHAHRRLLRRGGHHSIKLQRAWDKHGEDAFSFEVIETCKADDLTAREQFWTDTLEAAHKDRGYSVCPIVGKTTRGVKHLRKRAPWTDARRAAHLACMLGRRASPETRAKMSNTHQGHATSEETRAKIAAGQHRRPPPTAETRAKMSKGQTGRKHSDVTKAKMRAAHAGQGVGRKATESTKQKMRDGWAARQNNKQEKPDGT